MEVAEVPEENVDIAFKKIGAGLSLLSPDAKVSSGNPPARALAVSNRFGLTIFATPAGFGVARTADVVALSKESKPVSVVEKCLLSVELESVWIVELSKDDLTLAVCAGPSIRFYSVAALVLKAQTSPFEVRSIGENASIKDFQWCSVDQEKSKYIVLSVSGTLLVGNVGEDPKPVKDYVAAACWSQYGKQMAYVISRQLTIASADFAKSSIIDLPSDLPSCEEGLDTEVDALRWISEQSILISFVQSEDDEEIACPLFVLSATKLLDEACTDYSGLVVSRKFPAIEPTIIPAKSSPYMLVQTLEPWKLVLATCRRSIDAHVILLGWGSGALCSFELSNDMWRPAIPMFDSSSDNVLTGLAIDRTSLLRQPDPRTPEQLLPPSPVLLCTSLDNRLLLYSVLRLDGDSWYKSGLVSPPSSLVEYAAETAEKVEPVGNKLDIERKAVAPEESKASKYGTLVNNTQARPFSASKTVNEQMRKAQFDLNRKEKEPQEQEEPVHKNEAGRSLRTPAANGNESSAVQSKSQSTVATKSSSALPMKSTSAPVLSNKKNPDADRHSLRSAGISDMEADFLAELDKVKRIAHDIDGFMDMIEKDNGRSSGLTRSGVDKLETDILSLSTRCRDLTHKLQDNCQLVEELRDQSLDVDSWRIYVESRVEQASDSRYQDLWVHRKLHPEMEIKRKRVISADEKLKKQISELEAHLHSLELNRRQNMHSKTTGHFQSIQNLYSTVNSQMEAADRLCMHLGDLMEALNISPSTTSLHPRKIDQAMQSKLIGVKPESSFFTPSKHILTDDFAVPESTRRRRDSMDSAWAGGIGATKTTIKRVVRPVNVVSSRKADIRDSHESSGMGSNAVQKSQTSSRSQSVKHGVTEEVSSTRAPPASFQIVDSKDMATFPSKASAMPQYSPPLPDVEEVVSKPQSISSSDAVSFNGANPSNLVTSKPPPTSLFATTPTSDTVSVNKTKASDHAAVRRPSSSSTSTSDSAPVRVAKVSTAAISISDSVPPMTVTQISTSAAQSPAFSSTLDSNAIPAIPVDGFSNFNVSSSATGGPEVSQLKSTSSSSVLPLPTTSLSKISTRPDTFNGGVVEVPSLSKASATLALPSFDTTPEVPRTSDVQSATISFPASSDSTSTQSIKAATEVLRSSSPLQAVSQTTITPSSPPLTTAFSSKPLIPTSSPSASFASVPALQPLIAPSPSSSPFPALVQSQKASQSARPTPEEDDMEEEAPSTAVSGFGSLGLGSGPSSATTANPFGVTSPSQSTGFGGLSAPPPGQLFRPAAFSLSSPTTAFGTTAPGSFSNASSTATGFGQSSSGFGQSSSKFGQGSGGFGQPSALGSALGAFGQTRQVGFGGGTPVFSSSGGFASPLSGAGFASASTGGGFATASSGGGFAAAASSGGGFAVAASAGGGFAGAATGGGFQAFGSGGGFGSFVGNASPSGFGSLQPSSSGFLSGAAQPNSLFTAMRK